MDCGLSELAWPWALFCTLGLVLCSILCIKDHWSAPLSFSKPAPDPLFTLYLIEILPRDQSPRVGDWDLGSHVLVGFHIFHCASFFSLLFAPASREALSFVVQVDSLWWLTFTKRAKRSSISNERCHIKYSAFSELMAVFDIRISSKCRYIDVSRSFPNTFKIHETSVRWISTLDLIHSVSQLLFPHKISIFDYKNAVFAIADKLFFHPQ